MSNTNNTVLGLVAAMERARTDAKNAAPTSSQRVANQRARELTLGFMLEIITAAQDAMDAGLLTALTESVGTFLYAWRVSKTGALTAD